MPRLASRLSIALVLGLAGLAPSCGGGGSDAEGSAEPLTGAQLYSLQACHTCHGQNGTGGLLGPELRGLAAHWDAPKMAAYLADPRGAIADDERLRALDQQYRTDMKPFAHLSQEERERLATYVLSFE